MDVKSFLTSKKAALYGGMGSVLGLASTASAEINWTSTTTTVENAIGLIGSIVSEIVNIIPDVIVLVIMLSIAAFTGGFLKALLGKIRSA